jgi:hypothetical protein
MMDEVNTPEPTYSESIVAALLDRLEYWTGRASSLNNQNKQLRQLASRLQLEKAALMDALEQRNGRR